jgi:cysteinyl-tRNA synthetase
MNITDVEDKIIKRSRELDKNFEEISRFWEADFFEDMQ